MLDRRWKLWFLISLCLTLSDADRLLAQAPLPGSGAASGPQTQPPQNGPEAIRQRDPSFLVQATANHETGDYREGDALSLKVVCEADAYIYVLYKQPDGKTYQIYPNVTQPDNRVRARQTVQVPGFDDRFRWQISAPFGDEVIKVIASKEPLDLLSDPELRQKRFNPITNRQIKGVELELGDEPAPSWAEHEIAIHTYPRSQEVTESGARRFGVFFGVSDYEFNPLIVEASDGKESHNLSSPQRNAAKMAEVMRQVGQLSDARVFVNEQATRANMEYAITGWLKKVSRPGDTVVFYYAGHGGQVPDLNGDETDGMDEYLLPHDVMGITELALLLKKNETHPLDEKLLARVNALIPLLKGKTEDQMRAILAHETGVTDDLFGHWVQSLSGRQVVIVLDSCHSGGFSPNETASPKSKSLGAANSFDFLDAEFARLKDLGQRDTALLAACQANETSAEVVRSTLSMMTGSLVECLRGTRGPVDLKKAYEDCKAGIARINDQLNAAMLQADPSAKPEPPFVPVYLNECLKPVFLKP